MALKRLFAQQERQPVQTPKNEMPQAETPEPVPSSVATDRTKESERKPTEPVPITPEREPGEDEAGILGVWPPKAWSLAEWVKGARGDFHVLSGLFGVKPISRGFSWKD